MNNIISEEDPIFPKTVNRIVIIDKEDYILSYKHNKIENYSNENVLNTNLDIGKFYLTLKNEKNGKYTSYTTADKILAKETINKNVLNNDKFLIKKIVEILEGSSNHLENFKIEGNIFKIIHNVQQIKQTGKKDFSGIHIIIFTCELTKTKLNSFEDILLISMRYFKNKKK